MGLLRYIIQGFGNEVGAQAAREAIEQVKDRLEESDEEPTPEAIAKVAKREARAAKKEARRREKEILRQLKKLKKQSKQS
jgi:hypothetical protein